MKLVMTVVWYPWTEGVRGPAGTAGAYRNLFLEMDDPKFARLPAVGELIFFEDGGNAPVETIGWRIDGTPYLYLGERYEKNGEPLTVWTGRGFKEREPAATQKLQTGEAGPQASGDQETASGGATAAGEPAPPIETAAGEPAPPGEAASTDPTPTGDTAGEAQTKPIAPPQGNPIPPMPG